MSCGPVDRLPVCNRLSVDVCHFPACRDNHLVDTDRGNLDTAGGAFQRRNPPWVPGSA